LPNIRLLPLPASAVLARYAKRPLQPLLALALLATGGLLLTPPPAHAQQRAPAGDEAVIDEIVAVVGDDVILRSEVEGQFQAIMQRQRQQQGRLPPRDQVWDRVLRNRIGLQVRAIHARRDTTISAPDSRVQQALEQRIDRLAQRAGGRSALEQAYGKSISQLKADFEEPIRDQLLAQRFRQRRMREVSVTPSEVRAWFEDVPRDSLPTVPATVQLSHIVRYPEASESARQRAREIAGSVRDSILAGVPIEEMARRYSDDSATASQGGQMERQLSELVPSFAAVVSRVPIGEVTDVFKTRFGYHVARVNERSGNTVKLNHVLIEVDKSDASGAGAQQYLKAVRDTITSQGAPFALMASRHSEERRSARQGGRVTDSESGESTLRMSKLNASWKSTLRDLEEGQISQPREVELLSGERAFHIVKLTERTPRHEMSLDEDYARIKQYALRQKKQRIYRQWVKQLREDVYVDVRVQPGELSASAR
jgi:peptidyl-prolyl cis-trans isomerase SurA